MTEWEMIEQWAYTLYRAGDYERAVETAREALEVAEENLGPEDLLVATSLSNLALYYGALCDFAKAEPLYVRALAIMEKALGAKHPDVAVILSKLGDLHRVLGDYSKAEPLFIRALAIWEEALDAEAYTVALGLRQLAELYIAIGNFDKALLLYKREFVIVAKVKGLDHPNVAMSLNSMAVIYKSLGDGFADEDFYVFGDSLPEEGLGTMQELSEQFASENYSMAESHFKRSLFIFEDVLGAEDQNVGIVTKNLGELYIALGDHVKAENLLNRSLSILETDEDGETPLLARCLNCLAEVYRATNRIDEAVVLEMRATKISDLDR
jgi:tetratricopeptide (TPR) repeat protein